MNECFMMFASTHTCHPFHRSLLKGREGKRQNDFDRVMITSERGNFLDEEVARLLDRRQTNDVKAETKEESSLASLSTLISLEARFFRVEARSRWNGVPTTREKNRNPTKKKISQRESGYKSFMFQTHSASISHTPYRQQKDQTFRFASHTTRTS